MTSGNCKNRKRVSNKVLKFIPLRDTHGDYIPFCSYIQHPGIVYNGQHKKCERRGCYHYMRFRPAAKQKKRCREIVVLKSLNELNVTDLE